MKAKYREGGGGAINVWALNAKLWPFCTSQINLVPIAQEDC